ncbi:MAG: hypothetical protein AM325_007820 [Candidatus Thorarchaeota archaeon SMTZ1-45]|nr:MAG: hypothetical protein AM325_09540 [Candidatus Thorarchaeota archaeon SMTZ1-45]
MSQLLEVRRSVRRRVISIPKYDVLLHRFITGVLIVNMILILYTLIFVTFSMTLNGVGFIDSLPIAFYILPMIIFLPIMILAYYRDRLAIWNFIFLVICTVFFGMLSVLVRGFIICLIFNLAAVISLFIMGRFRPRGKLRAAGKKTVVYLILVNLLGLAFPISTVLMGQYPIASPTVNTSPEIRFSVPLADFEYPYQDLTPTSQLLANLSTNSYQLDLHVLESDSTSWSKLRTWLLVLNDTELSYSITLSADRASLVGINPQTLATTELIENIYESHRNALDHLMNVELVDISNEPEFVLFDMTLSRTEWQALMLRTRNLDLVGFGGLVRSSIYSTDITRIENASSLLYDATIEAGISSGLIVETFVMDDLIDSDSIAMRFCGVTSNSIQEWNQISILCSRSRFSFEMNGDVGEYLVHSYSSSIAGMGSPWSIRIGELGNSTDVLSRTDNVYENFDVLVNDIALTLGNGVSLITLESLPSFLNAFGSDALTTFRLAIDETENGVATYTFRIYAFRAVFLAIDAFDFLMF